MMMTESRVSSVNLLGVKADLVKDDKEVMLDNNNEGDGYDICRALEKEAEVYWKWLKMIFSEIEPYQKVPMRTFLLKSQ